MKNLKHVKLFEAFSSGEAPFLIGYYGEGGHGSHPSIFTADHLREFGFREQRAGSGSFWDKEYSTFIETSESLKLPDALICVFDEDYQWDIKEISKSTAEEVMSIIGGDHVNNYNDGIDLATIIRIMEMTGVYSGLSLDRGRDFETNITIILNPQPNTVYWSDEPELTHSYWEPPYKPMSLEDLGINR